MNAGMFAYGRVFTLAGEGEFRGFLRPLSLPEGESLRFRTPPGISGPKYLLIAPPGFFSAEDTAARLYCEGWAYELLRVERKVVGDREIHCECLLRLLGRTENA